jgi:hypothetical protein
VPIEIKELHIRVAVNAGDAGSATVAGAPAGVPSAAPADQLDTVVAACVEQVMQLLRDRTER